MSRLIYSIFLVFILLIPACEKEEEPRLPVVKTGTAINTDYTSTTISGSIVDEGSSEILVHGFLWSEATSSLENKITCGSPGLNSFSVKIKGLKPGNKYSFKAFAINNAGISFGESVTLTTQDISFPQVETKTISSITSNSVVISGMVSEYGDTIKDRGFCWCIKTEYPQNVHNISEGKGSGSFESNINGLSPNFEYYIWAYATNSKGTSFGQKLTFLTVTYLADAKTLSVNIIKPTSATCNMKFSILNRNDILKYGICWNNVSIPTIEDSVSFQSGPSWYSEDTEYTFYIKTEPNTRYIARAFATSKAGTVYGDTITFTSWLNSPGPRIADADGNVYPTVKIGKQVWMAENLRTTKYRNGDEIGTTADPRADIQTESDPKYQWPAKFDEDLSQEYGRWYTWFAATDTRGICPAGWHLPSKDEWSELAHFLSPGPDLKISEKSEVHWYKGYKGNNLSGFTARALNYRSSGGTFWNSYSSTYWWTNNEVSGKDNEAYYVPINTGYSYAGDKKAGLVVRCIKD